MSREQTKEQRAGSKEQSKRVTFLTLLFAHCYLLFEKAVLVAA